MKYLAVLLPAVVALIAATPAPQEGQVAIAKARQNADSKLMKALAGVDLSVVRLPRKELVELESAGKRDQDEIAALANGQDVSAQRNTSSTFWINKMDEVIAPYIKNPGNYKEVIVDLPFCPQDPDWNDTKEYKDAEQKICESIEVAVKELKEMYMKELDKIKAKKVEEVTASGYAKLKLERLLRSEERALRNSAQWSKQDAADGLLEAAFETQKTEIATCKTEFTTLASNICKEYEKSIKK